MRISIAGPGPRLPALTPQLSTAHGLPRSLLVGNATVDGFLSFARPGGRSYRAWTRPCGLVWVIIVCSEITSTSVTRSGGR
jgi:hypothetical protein